MSTVPEVLAAREEGLQVIALSLVTNFVVIPDTYRSMKAEVQAEVSPIPFPSYSGSFVHLPCAPHLA
jgi:purine-nucleoside phosphorylase